jgi:lipopolysaccharide transport system permease protein
MSNTPWFSRRRLAYLRDILKVLVGRDIKLRYKRSVMGIAWTLLNPLAELLTLLFIFTIVLPLKIPHYAAFLFTGLLVYGWFQSSLFFAANTIVASRELVRQPGFPPAILPIVSVTSNLVHFLLALPILVVFLIIGHAKITFAVLVLPILIAVQFVLTLSLAYVVAAVHVRFRDTQYLLKVVLQFLFYLSPVFYATRDVPERFRPLYALNPLAFVIDAYRDVLIFGQLPRALPILGLTMVSVALLVIGLGVFRRASYRFVEELG